MYISLAEKYLVVPLDGDIVFGKYCHLNLEVFSWEYYVDTDLNCLLNMKYYCANGQCLDRTEDIGETFLQVTDLCSRLKKHNFAFCQPEEALLSSRQFLKWSQSGPLSSSDVDRISLGGLPC